MNHMYLYNGGTVYALNRQIRIQARSDTLKGRILNDKFKDKRFIIIYINSFGLPNESRPGQSCTAAGCVMRHVPHACKQLYCAHAQQQLHLWGPW